MRLAAECVKKDFEDMKVLKDVSVSVETGEFVSILGPSGAGKSTLFNVLSGLSRPDGGRVLVDGEDQSGKTGFVGYMVQKDLLLPWYSVLKNTALPLLVKGVPKAEAMERAKAYFPEFGLSGFEGKYPFQLSGGMRQRAALLRTRLMEKEILLLDEPFGSLDMMTKRKMQFWLSDLFQKSKIGICFITHDIEEALFLSDRIYILSQRPAVVREEISVGFSRPRGAALLSTPEFLEKKRRIENMLL